MLLSEKEYRFGLSRLHGVGLAKYKLILDKFHSAQEFFESNLNDLKSLLGENLALRVHKLRDEIDIQKQLDILNSKEINYVTLGCREYPLRLKHIVDPPIVLYYKGNFDINILNKTITIVGTRNCTSYGVRFLEGIIPQLVDKGFVTASGLAFGIDYQVHKQTIDSNGKTVAVLASSVDQCTPSSHYDLYDSIIKSNGLILSENFPGSEVSKGNFASRNRILAGLSASTIVVEAPVRSGSLITGHLAFDYDRLVMTIPGRIDDKYISGNNSLIKNHKAQLVENIKDIFDQLGVDSLNYKQGKRIDYDELHDLEINLIELIGQGYNSVDGIKKKIDIDTNELLASLVKLEIKGFVRKDEFDQYIILN